MTTPQCDIQGFAGMFPKMLAGRFVFLFLLKIEVFFVTMLCWKQTKSEKQKRKLGIGELATGSEGSGVAARDHIYCATNRHPYRLQ